MQHNDIETILYTEDELRARTKELAAQISKDYEGKDLVVVGLLTGCFVFAADLVRSISIPCEIKFMHVSSYGSGTTSSGVLEIKNDLSMDLAGKHLLFVDDIIDTGWTYSYLLERYTERHPASISLCTLLDKPDRREASVKSQYNGFSIPNHFVVGYGLDYDGRYRNLPYVGVLKPEVYNH